ncbi:MAG: tetratricopeptide repeat protein [Desulfobulbaceae bacterium]|nr:tetratricopeptide repeat protein [Desulfobulbaceae bacterium]HIJ78374.1 tetratricopeptide repeat protein [Deltaproteobacteria bacterium]
MKLKSPKDMNFLIVDDVDNMRRSVKAMLKLIHYGKSFYEAANGRDAWQILQDENVAIDFIVSDYNMPYVSGTELLNLIRGSKKLRDIPFLMITAEANMDIVAEAAEHDVDAYMTKPFVTATLEQKVNELLGQINNPNEFTKLLLVSRTLEEAGDIDGAIDAAKKASQLNGQSSRPYRELGRLFVKKGDLPKGQICFEKATDINRLDVSSYHALGQIYFRQGKVDKAMENFSRAMDISPRHSDRALNFAKLLMKKNLLKEAEKVLRLVLKTKANDADFKEDIADSCRDFGIYDLAVKTYREVLKLDPERYYLNKKIGLTQMLMEDLNEAVKSLEKAADKFTEDIEVMLALSRAYFKMKMKMRADKWATKIVRIDPGHKEARDIMNQCL